MGLASGELLYMGIGEVTAADMQAVGKLVPASLSANSVPKPGESVTKDTGSHTTSRTSQDAGDEAHEALFMPTAGGRDTAGNPLHTIGAQAEIAGAEVTAERASDGFHKHAKAESGKALSPEQELPFLSLYQKRPNINAALKQMNLGTGYYRAAAAVVARFNVRHKR